MSKILLKGRPYGGSTTVTDALHLLTKDTLNADVSAQNMLTNILGDMAQLETSTAATKAYAKGEYLVLGSYFYKVIATIDPGDTLTVGTNIEQTNVGAEMSEALSIKATHTISTNGIHDIDLIPYKLMYLEGLAPDNHIFESQMIVLYDGMSSMNRIISFDNNVDRRQITFNIYYNTSLDPVTHIQLQYRLTTEAMLIRLI